MPFWLLLMLRMSDIWARAPGGHYANERQQRERERETFPFSPPLFLCLSRLFHLQMLLSVQFKRRRFTQHRTWSTLWRKFRLTQCYDDDDDDDDDDDTRFRAIHTSSSASLLHLAERVCTMSGSPFFFLCSCFLPFKPKVSESNNPVNKRTV